MRLIDSTHVKETGARTDDEASLVKASDAGGIVIRLPIRQVCANVGQVNHRGQTGVPRSHFKRTDLLDPDEGQPQSPFLGNGNAPHTPSC